MNHFEKVFQCFPPEIRLQLNNLSAAVRHSIEEIRVYRDREVQVFAAGSRMTITGTVSGAEINGLLNNLMKFSYYAYEEDLAKGFITIDGGHRVGICGKAVMDRGRVTLIRDISSLNIRYSREIPGCADSLMPMIFTENGQLHNLLIVSPPGCGKTTLLRDIAAQLSRSGIKTAICDERSEIAGMYSGIPSYSFGVVDVLDGCPKAEGIAMMIRAMSPQVIVTDEIGKTEDLAAIKACSASGVNLVTTIHGSSMEELRASEIGITAENGTFPTIVFLTNRPRVGTIREVYHD